MRGVFACASVFASKYTNNCGRVHVNMRAECVADIVGRKILFTRPHRGNLPSI